MAERKETTTPADCIDASFHYLVYEFANCRMQVPYKDYWNSEFDNTSSLDDYFQVFSNVMRDAIIESDMSYRRELGDKAIEELETLKQTVSKTIKVDTPRCLTDEELNIIADGFILFINRIKALSGIPPKTPNLDETCSESKERVEKVMRITYIIDCFTFLETIFDTKFDNQELLSREF